MQRKIVIGLISIGLGWGSLFADVSEMIFYPQADFSEGILHFNYQGTKNKNYGFMFDRGFDPARLVYVRPENNTIEKLKDGTIKLSFANTDRYSYVQRAYKDDFLVSEENGIYKILLSGGDCKGSPDCVTAENILTVNVPKGYGVRKYQGLDQELKPLINPQWQIKGNVFTLTARDVKGACVMMELEKLKSGETITPMAVVNPVVTQKPVATVALKTPEPTSVVTASTVKVPSVAVSKPIASVAEVLTPYSPVNTVIPPVVTPKTVNEKPSIPSPYFRNFQLFDNRIVALNEAGKARLREWAVLFKEGRYKSVTINGYTDNIPPQRLKALYATNEILSEARGKTVAEYLEAQGIDSKAITVHGMGDANPVAPNETEEGRSKNRRIEFILN